MIEGLGDRLPRDRLSILGLTLANLLPLAGVFLWDWDAAGLVLLYWTENLIVGAFNILKLLFVRTGRPREGRTKLVAILFFIAHYGIFCWVHGLFLLVFFKLGGGLEDIAPSRAWPGPLVLIQLFAGIVGSLWKSQPQGMNWAVAALIGSHGLSFIENYVIGKEYASFTIREFMNQPYRRVILMHVALIAGALPTMALGSPLPLLVILVVLKIGVDLHLHAKSHRARPSAQTAAGPRLPLTRRGPTLPDA